MALTNHERVGKALTLLRKGLGPFVDREVNRAVQANQVDHHVLRRFADDSHLRDRPVKEWDVAAVLKLMMATWKSVFRPILGHAERSYVSELLEYRNAWAHQQRFTGDDAHRVLDTAARLLTSVSASQAVEVDRLRKNLLRRRFDEQSRRERRKSQTKLAVGAPQAR